MAKNIPISVSGEIFELAPDFRRAIIFAQGAKNGPSGKTLQKLLREQEEKTRQSITIDDPRLVAWREVFRAAGIKPNKFRPSIDALTRRVLNGNELPSISTLVDIGTIVSLKYVLPSGAHSLHDVRESLALRKASGTESYVPFGSTVRESIEPGEIIFTDGDEVATSKWVWRQAVHTIVRPETTASELNIDALSIITDEQLRAAIDDARDLLRQFLGVESSAYILDINTKLVNIEVQ